VTVHDQKDARLFSKKQKAVKVSTLGEIETLAASGKPVLVDF
jgi:hypothetical protein